MPTKKGEPRSPAAIAATDKMLAALKAKRELKAQMAAEEAPHEDPDFVANRLADDARGVQRHDPQPPPPAYVDPQGDPDIESSKLVVQMLQDEQRKAEAERAKRPPNSRQSLRETNLGRIPVEMRIEMPKMPDALAFEDDDGTSLLKKGYRGRWVRIKDDLDQHSENTLRVRRMRAWGGEVVMKADGTPLKMETLIAMQLPILADAKRIIAASRSGAYDAVGQLSNSADKLNSDFSKRHYGASQGVIQVEPISEHGSEVGGVRPFARGGD